jgi:hypothetical protein
MGHGQGQPAKTGYRPRDRGRRCRPCCRQGDSAQDSTPMPPLGDAKPRRPFLPSTDEGKTAGTEDSRVSASGEPVRYEIRVAGVLDSRWAAWFDGVAISRQGDETVICGLLTRLRCTGCSPRSRSGPLANLSAQARYRQGRLSRFAAGRRRRPRSVPLSPWTGLGIAANVGRLGPDGSRAPRPPERRLILSGAATIRIGAGTVHGPAGVGRVWHGQAHVGRPRCAAVRLPCRRCPSSDAIAVSQLPPGTRPGGGACREFQLEHMALVGAARAIAVRAGC